MKRFVYAILVTSLVLLGATLVWVGTRPTEVPKVTATVKQGLPLTRENLLKLVNEERAKVGVAPLVMDSRINTSAQMKADDMEEHGYYGHTNHNGTSGTSLIFRVTGQLCVSGGENLVRGGEREHIAEVAVGRWTESKAHYDAMIDAGYSLTGFGITGSSENWIITQHFCKP